MICDYQLLLLGHFIQQATCIVLVYVIHFSAGQKLVLELWKEKSTSPMLAVNLGFSVGSLVVPQIADPFLAVLKEHQSANNDSVTNSVESNTAPTLIMTRSSLMQNTSTTLAISDHTSLFIKETRIQWAYMIVAIVAFAVSMPFFCFQICGKSYRNIEVEKTQTERKDSSLVSMIDPKTCANGNRIYGLQIFLLLFLFSFQAFGGEYICAQFIRSYAIDTYSMDGDEASWLNTSFWISYTIGTFLGFITGRWVPIRKLILIECVGMLISTILFAIFAQRNATFLWIFTQSVGAFIAPAFPLCMVWGDAHVKLTGFAITIICFGGSLGGFVYLWIVGHLYDSKGPHTFLYSCVICGLLMCLFAFALHFISIGKDTRYKNEETVSDSSNMDYIEKVNFEQENDGHHDFISPNVSMLTDSVDVGS